MHSIPTNSLVNGTLPKGRAPRYDDVFFASVAWLDSQ